jgi:hypothetical protein
MASQEDLNKATVLKAGHLQVILELRLPTSLNTVECLNQMDRNQQVLWLLNSRQVNSQVHKVDTVGLLLNPLLNTEINKWFTVALLALAVMVVVNQHKILSGLLLLPRILAMVLVATKDDLCSFMIYCTSFRSFRMV